MRFKTDFASQSPLSKIGPKLSRDRSIPMISREELRPIAAALTAGYYAALPPGLLTLESDMPDYARELLFDQVMGTYEKFIVRLQSHEN